MTRVVRASEGSLLVGRSLAGRGAWLCHGSPECLDVAARKGGFARAFRAPVDRAAVEQLRLRWPIDDDGAI